MPVKTRPPDLKPAVVLKRQAQRPSKLDEAAYKRAEEVFEMLGTSRARLSEEEAASGLDGYVAGNVDMLATLRAIGISRL